MHLIYAHTTSGCDVFHALTKVLPMSSFISIDKEERVTTVDEASAMRTFRGVDALTVPDYQETVSITWTGSAGQTCRTLMTWSSRSAIGTCRLKNIICNEIISRGQFCSRIFLETVGGCSIVTTTCH